MVAQYNVWRTTCECKSCLSRIATRDNVFFWSVQNKFPCRICFNAVHWIDETRLSWEVATLRRNTVGWGHDKPRNPLYCKLWPWSYEYSFLVVAPSVTHFVYRHDSFLTTLNKPCTGCPKYSHPSCDRGAIREWRLPITGLTAVPRDTMVCRPEPKPSSV